MQKTIPYDVSESDFQKKNNTIFMLKNTILPISRVKNIFYLFFFKNLSRNSEIIFY